MVVSPIVEEKREVYFFEGECHEKSLDQEKPLDEHVSKRSQCGGRFDSR